MPRALLMIVSTLACLAAAGPLSRAGAQDASISQQQMVGSLIMIGFRGQSPNDPGSQLLASALKDRRIGGVLTVKRNFGDGQAAKLLATGLQGASPDGLPVLIGIDQEGGLIQRLGPAQGWKPMPSAEAIARDLSPAEAEALYRRVACTLRHWGFTYNLGPVVDLVRQPDNPVIVKLHRSFGSQAKIVAAYAASAVRAHRACGVLTALKHFPGHGSSLHDSHKGLTDVTNLWHPEEMDPFALLIRQGLADSIMTAHISHAHVDPDLPASLSPIFIGDVLRQTLGYQGLVISDDMTMGAIADHYGSVEAAVQALRAGADMVMVATPIDEIPELPEQIIAGILAAIEAGTLDWARIEQAFARVQAARASLQR